MVGSGSGVRAGGAPTVRCEAGVRDGHAASSDADSDAGNVKEHTLQPKLFSLGLQTLPGIAN